MTDVEFKQLFKASSLRMLYISLIVMLVGVLVLGFLLAFPDATSRRLGEAGNYILWIFGAVILFLGVYKTYIALKQYLDIQSGQHSLLKAIADQDQKYVTLFFFTDDDVNSGGRSGFIKGITICTKENRLRFYSKNEHYQNILNYLGEKFPNAVEANAN